MQLVLLIKLRGTEVTVERHQGPNFRGYRVYIDDETGRDDYTDHPEILSAAYDVCRLLHIDVNKGSDIILEMIEKN